MNSSGEIIVSAYELPGQVKEWLEKHGCSIEGNVVHFPPGTTRTLKQPMCTQARYDIALPDGSHCQEQDLRGMIKDRSILFVPIDKTPIS